MVNYRELRCRHCRRLLAIGSGSVQIKCNRCKTINHFN
ncbi:zinc finger domain-containing protein [Neisseria montereyensis]|uniref:Com family DNA-binding transcriptional regulator n=1 Tax=Neisseria montereyensis TaxID=2973938 RepID=A0ABT2FFH6_9NEIS|nr:Com family DNA-binding transcriptional regulator [Neisseria montereyensis]MCS4534228.1 Com family DNA-binding transcriptional regulator [Neisseria montereyensis]